MLTTHGLVQNTATYLFPALLLIIAWYSVAASLRSFAEFLYRFRQKRSVGKNIKALSKPLDKSQSDGMSHTMAHYLGGLQNAIEESLLIGKQATGARIAFAFLEALLFTTLAVASFYTAGPLLERTKEVWWIHPIGAFFFLCFILKARRILLLIPLTFIALLSWEVVSFITGFERTLEATTLMATIDIKKSVTDPKKPNEPPRVTMDVTFRGKEPREVVIPVGWKLYFEGRVYRVSTEVLLFGGRNLATIDKIFSDVMPSAKGVQLVKNETIPPLYQWKDDKTPNYLLPQKKLFRWIWKEFFQLRKKQYIGSKNPVQMKLLQAAVCPGPIRPGRRFAIKLRNVGGLECHTVKVVRRPPTIAPVRPIQRRITPRPTPVPTPAPIPTKPSTNQPNQPTPPTNQPG